MSSVITELFKEIFYRLIFCIISTIVTFIIFFFFKECLLINSINDLYNLNKNLFPYLEFSSITELYIIYFKIIIFFVLIFNSPLYIYHIYIFYYKCLTNKQKKLYNFFCLFAYIYNNIILYLILKKIVPYIYTLTLNLQLDPNNNLGISLDFHFQVSNFINLIFILIIFFITINCIILYICFKNINTDFNIKQLYDIKKMIIIFFAIIFILLLPPDIKIQITIGIFIIFYIENIIILFFFFNILKKVNG